MKSSPVSTNFDLYRRVPDVPLVAVLLALTANPFRFSGTLQADSRERKHDVK